MMTRRLITLVVAFALLWPAAARAQGDVLDWLGQLSGPGPYKSYPNPWPHSFFVRLFCVTEANGRHDVDTCIDDTDENIKIVVDADYGFTTSRNSRFNDVAAALEPFNDSLINVNLFDVNYSYRISPMLDVGIGVGTMIFSGDGFNNLTRVTLTPFRISFVPLGYFSGKTGQKWGRVLRIKYSNRRIIGDLSAADFGSTKSTFVTHGEFNQAVEISLDFWPFISGWVRKK
jgi:hypothetical protein